MVRVHSILIVTLLNAIQVYPSCLHVSFLCNQVGDVEDVILAGHLWYACQVDGRTVLRILVVQRQSDLLVECRDRHRKEYPLAELWVHLVFH